MIDDVNSNSSKKNPDLENKGYGYLPMETKIDQKSSILFDKKSKI